MAATAARTPAPAAPGLQLIIGDDFAERARNLGRNLAEGRVALIRAVLVRP